MPILTARNLSQSFGGFTVFKDVHIAIEPGAKIGMVGPNGIGKTTLLRILAGLTDSSTGSVSRSKHIRLGYLRQEAMEAFADRDMSVLQEMHSVFSGLQAQEDPRRADGRPRCGF
jgi:ATP-binding cassette subfamily F protein 3